MARANLAIGADLQASFTGAQEDKSIRWIEAKVEGEAVILGNIGTTGTSIAEDFDALSTILSDRSATFLIFAVDETPEPGFPRSFVLISWVPDLCPVREKMLISSSLEQLKTTLGSSNFESDYHCTEPSDISWTMYKESRNASDEKVLTDHERIKAEIDAQESAGKAVTKAVAMGSVNFPLEDTLRDQLDAFLKGSVNVIECSITPKETIDLTKSYSLDLPATSIGEHISSTAPSFVFIRFPINIEETTSRAGGLFKDTHWTLFVFCCPAGSSPRQRMTFSTGKAAVVAGATSCGLSIDKTLEVNNEEGKIEQITLCVKGCGNNLIIFNLI